MADKEKQLILPTSVVSGADVGALLRKLNELEDFLAEAAARKPGSAVTLPKAGRLAEICKLNDINLLKATERKALTAELKSIQTKAPVVHMSFASDASVNFTNKLLQWFRAKIHPHVLLHIGLQPNLAAGCVMRTPSKYFDFSLRQRLQDANGSLLKRLEVSGG